MGIGLSGSKSANGVIKGGVNGFIVVLLYFFEL
jgi:hypothetical protein